MIAAPKSRQPILLLYPAGAVVADLKSRPLQRTTERPQPEHVKMTGNRQDGQRTPDAHITFFFLDFTVTGFRPMD